MEKAVIKGNVITFQDEDEISITEVIMQLQSLYIDANKVLKSTSNRGKVHMEVGEAFMKLFDSLQDKDLAIE